MKSKLHYAWLILLGVILIRGFAGGGINMTSSLFLSPVSSDLGIGIGNLSIYYSITSIVMVFWLPTAGKLINKYDIRLIAIAGGAFQSLSFLSFGFLSKVYGWYLLAIPYAMGSTLVVNLLGPILINRWFAKNTGMMLGIQMAFVGIFGIVLQPLASVIIENYGWRQGYFILGMSTFVVITASSLLLLKNNPKDIKLTAYGKENEKPVDLQTSVKNTEINISKENAIHSLSFYLLLIFMIAMTGVGVFTQHIPTYGALLGFTLGQTGTALAFASAGSALGSIAIGIVSDKIGGLKTCFAIVAIGIIEIIGFVFCFNNIFIFFISTFIHGLVSSSVMVLSPILTMIFYGKNDYEKIYANVAMGAPLASIILIPLYGFIYDTMNNYFPVLLCMLALLLLAALSIIWGWKKRCTAAGCPTWGK